MSLRMCSVCGAEVAFDRRTALAVAKLHYEWRVGPSGPYQTAVACPGAGRPTEGPPFVPEVPAAPVEPAIPGREPADLTQAEARMARLLRDTDLSAPELARELSLSVNTVKTHILRIYRKVGVGSRRDLQSALKGRAK